MWCVCVCVCVLTIELLAGRASKGVKNFYAGIVGSRCCVLVISALTKEVRTEPDIQLRERELSRRALAVIPNG